MAVPMKTVVQKSCHHKTINEGMPGPCGHEQGTSHNLSLRFASMATKSSVASLASSTGHEPPEPMATLEVEGGWTGSSDS